MRQAQVQAIMNEAQYCKSRPLGDRDFDRFDRCGTSNAYAHFLTLPLWSIIEDDLNVFHDIDAEEDGLVGQVVKARPGYRSGPKGEQDVKSWGDPPNAAMASNESTLRTQSEEVWADDMLSEHVATLGLVGAPKGDLEMKQYIAALQKQRADVSREAELLWHHLAKCEGEYIDPTLSAEAVEAVGRRMNIIMNLHSFLWMEVSMYDWMLADTKRRILHFQAKKRNEPWSPSLPAEADSTRLKLSLAMLEEDQAGMDGLIQQTVAMRDQLRASIKQKSVGDIIDVSTGQLVEKKDEMLTEMLGSAEEQLEGLLKRQKEVERLQKELRTHDKLAERYG